MKYLKKLKIIFIISLLFGCQKEEINVNIVSKIKFDGIAEKIETLGHYSAADAATLLQLAGIKGKVSLSNDFYIYRVTYKTKSFNNKIVSVTGLLGIPNIAKVKGLVSYQHGTITYRNNSPSFPSPAEGLGLSSIFAGDGYILVAADYIGLGKSLDIPPYLHINSTVNAVVDLIKIGAKVLNNISNGQNKNLYLTGFSQGGNTSAGVQRALEINNETGLILKANAPIAGAYNLKDISIKYAVKNKSNYYLGYLSNSYSMVYNKNINTILQDKYVDLIPKLYDGSKDIDYILSQLPKEPKDMLLPNMIDDLINGNSNWFTDALAENETFNWKPKSPLSFFYGSEDIDVSKEDAISSYNYIKNIGGNVALVNVGPYTHNETILASLPKIQTWFNTIK